MPDGWIKRQLPEGEYYYPADGSQFSDGGLAPLVKSKPLTLTDIAPQQGTIQTIIDNLLGLNGRSRYRTWPEKMMRNAIEGPKKAFEKKPPPDDLQSKLQQLELMDEHYQGLNNGKPVHISGHMLVPVEYDPFSEERNAA